MLNVKENAILNNKLPFFFLFCLLGILYLGIRVDYWYFLLLVLLPCTIKINKLNKWQILLLSAIFLIFIFLLIWAYDFSLFGIFDSHISSHIKNFIVHFFDKHYSEETSSFIKLILLNIKTDETYIFLKQTVDLGIVWLISSGAFHLSLIARCVNFIFRKKKLVGFVVNITLISIYTLILGFAYGCVRVLLRNIFKEKMKHRQISRFNQLGMIGILICLLNPSCFKSYGFVMGFLVCIVSYFILSWNLKNKLLTTILINLFSFIVMIPFVIHMNHKISILTFVNTFIFAYLFMFAFLYLLVFSWMPFMAPIHSLIMKLNYILVGNISFSNVYIWSKDWAQWLITVYYLSYFVLSQITYLIVKNNKI